MSFNITKAKKITSLFLASILSFSMTACGGVPNKNSSSSSEKESSYSSLESPYSSEEESPYSSAEDSYSSLESWYSSEEESSYSSEENSYSSLESWYSSEEESSYSSAEDSYSSLESWYSSEDSLYSSEEESSSSENISTEDSSMQDSSEEEVLFFENGMPNYDAHIADEMIFNAWYAPKPDLAEYQEFLDCGFNRVFLMGHLVGGSVGLDASKQPVFDPLMDSALEICDQLGIKAYVDVSDCAIIEKCGNPNHKNCSAGVTAEQGKNAILKVVEKYSKYGSFAGLCYDEPVINSNSLNHRWGLVELSPVIESLVAQYSTTEFMVNLNPNSNIIPGWFNSQGTGWGPTAYTYEDYLEAQVQYINAHYAGTETLNWLSADDYPLFINGGGHKYLKPKWLECMAYLAVFKRDSSAKLATNFFLQSMPFESVTNASSQVRDRVPTYNDLRLQMYTLMAFGYDSISFFCYATPPIVNGQFSATQVALVDRDNNATSIYTASKQAIGEIKQFSNTYMNFSRGWKGVYTIIGSNNTTGTREDFTYLNTIGDGTTTKRMNSAKVSNTWFRQNGMLSATATEDTVIGCMNDSWNNPGLMIVNYNDTSENKTSTVELQFASAKYDKAWVYIDGVQNEVTLTNGKLTLNLDVGEGVFVIPVKKG